MTKEVRENSGECNVINQREARFLEKQIATSHGEVH